MGTQKNHLNEMVLLSTQKHVKPDGQENAQKLCLSKPIIITLSPPGNLYIVQAVKQAPVLSNQMSLCIKNRNLVV